MKAAPHVLTLAVGRAVLALLLLAGNSAFAASNEFAQGSLPSAKLESLLMDGNWKDFSEGLFNCGQATNPVSRLLLGHACLANNENDSSLKFFSSSSSQDIATWKEWAEMFVKNHPQNSIANYLLGDAEARSGNLSTAIASFKLALSLKPACPLVRNALGVALALEGDLDGAEAEFYQVTTEAPTFSDGYSNLGLMAVLRRSVPDENDGAFLLFDKALNINSNFSVAYNGRGCLYFGRKDFANAMSDFQNAVKINPLFSPGTVNEGITSLYKLSSEGALLKSTNVNTASVVTADAVTPSSVNAGNFSALSPTEQNQMIQGLRAQGFQELSVMNSELQNTRVIVDAKDFVSDVNNAALNVGGVAIASGKLTGEPLVVASLGLNILNNSSAILNAGANVTANNTFANISAQSGDVISKFALANQLRQIQLQVQVAPSVAQPSMSSVTPQFAQVPYRPQPLPSSSQLSQPGWNLSSQMARPQTLSVSQSSPLLSAGSSGIGSFNFHPPGGISMKEFDKFDIDKGDWPVLPVFGLAYAPTIRPPSNQKAQE